ncbi:site-specific integrase [Billgrantia kenyensis]|uniref:Site-specific integrase n=1 Tax=Billgrantia kenyensis TaxID=321266 RepID=A0A7W0AG18_9GAMM|nr:site-specific integrase [Halomonas kenyensis]MBA2781149.1 site-specific integrase [Halomonas kenyensis]MCG6663839.1 site-specific integrase [Halomonas kenyensis]
MEHKSLLKTENDVAKFYGWDGLSTSFVSREGVLIDTTTDTWILSEYNSAVNKLKFDVIEDQGVKWALKQYIKQRAQTVSSISALNAYSAIRTLVLRRVNGSAEPIEEALITSFENMLVEMRERQSIWRAYYPIRWYVWAADRYPEMGFDSEYANLIDAIEVGGNPKGQAIKSEDDEEGPLSSLELKLINKALREDSAEEYVCYQQRAVVALLIATGRNSENLTYLRESDFQNVAPHGLDPCYIIKMPRIKKGFISPRDDMLEESLDESLAQYVLDLIKANRENRDSISQELSCKPLPDTLFVNVTGNKAALALGVQENILNMTTHDIRKLLKDFVARQGIISPVTNALLHITPRRMRYTFGTNMVGEGASKKELARMLDHSNIQNVGVYYRLAGRIVEHLDKAMAKKYASVLNMFKGNIVISDAEAINGDRKDKHLSFLEPGSMNPIGEIGVCGESNVCHLDPPYSCYLCSKFQPYAHADHENVLSCLLEDREEKLKKYESKRLGIQLDDVIIAVAGVVDRCKEYDNEKKL